MRQYFIYKKGSLSVECFFRLFARFFDIWRTSQPLQQYPLKITAKPLVFSSVSTFLRRSSGKKIHVGQAACQSNRRGINEAMWDDGSCEKRGRNGFSRGKISFVDDTRASSHRARCAALSLSLAANTRSRGQKGLIEFLLINCLRGATIIATHELSHYRNCRSN